MKLYSLRLRPNQDLRISLMEFAKANDIRAGSIVTCVGSLKLAVLRMAGAKSDKKDVTTYRDVYEIVSLVGTITSTDCHLHIAISDSEGHVIGGHLKEGSIVDTTAEIVIAEDENVIYDRELDEETGFCELVIKQTPESR